MSVRTARLTDDIAGAAELICSGGLVAVPTETVYGLAGNGMDAAAVERIYEVKGRPSVKPLSLMVPGPEALDIYGRNIPRGARVLAEAFWPGPLTIVVEATPKIPPIVLAGGATVGLRCPDSPKTLELLRLAGVPLAAPSANPSGAPSPKTAGEVLAYFDGAIEAVIDGGPCGVGVESTIIDLTVSPYRILRRGALPAEDIRRALVDSLTVVGITGGTGAGKTTALESLRDMGALVLDADAVYHELCGQGGPMLDAISERFPGSVENGVLQRKKLGAVVFSDPAALADLDRITIHHVVEELDRRMAQFAAEGGRYAAIDAINLIGTEAESRLDTLVGVLAKPEVRAARLMAREGVSLDYAMNRIRAQKPDSFFIEHCDHILHNDGSREDFRHTCDELFKNILEG